MTSEKQIDEIIRFALAEDIGTGDITTLSTINKNTAAEAEFLVKGNGVIAGLTILEKIISAYDNSLKLKLYYADGDKVFPGDIAAALSGNATSILTVERTALNFMQRMSGIATLTNKYVELVKHTKARILDTRKTSPGLRLTDKLAVKAGGGTNHRIGLFDMFLIKDNHIRAAGSITKAIRACRKYAEEKNLTLKTEVETTILDEVKEALDAGVDIIMLDNFRLEELASAVNYINGRCLTEASGGINLNTVKSVAETGVDFISVGALTHSVVALDISLEIR